MPRRPKSSIRSITAAASCARTAGRACPAATTARAARSPRHSPRTLPAASISATRCTKRRTTRGTPFRMRCGPAWASSCPIASSGRARTMAAMRAERRWRGLYAVTPEMADTAALVARVEACLEGGAAMVQYRAKDATPGASLAQARHIAARCRAWGVPFIVNDSIPLALAVGADGIHVGRDDASVREARIAMPRGIVGASCYADPELARRAAAEGADYVGIGSMFASS